MNASLKLAGFAGMASDALVNVIGTYFQLGFRYKEILDSLAQRHGVVLCMRTLKRILNTAGLFRRKHKSDLLAVAVFIFDRLQQSG
jgi:hypothetical protein